MSNEGFSIAKLFRDSIKTLFRPKAFFRAMESSGGLRTPILKALSYGIIAGVFVLIWSFLDILGITAGYSSDVSVIGFFGAIFGAVIGVFIGGLIVMILSFICGGHTNYTFNMRVTAAIMVILPVSAILGIFIGVSSLLGAAIILAVHLYGVYMLYIALTVTLEGEQKPARAVSLIVGGLLIIALIIGFFTLDTGKDNTALNIQETEKVIRHTV